MPCQLQVEGLALEAVEHADLERILNSDDFQQRSGASLRWLQVGLGLVGEQAVLDQSQASAAY